MFCKKGVIRNFTKSTEKILAQFFPVNVVKLLRTPFCIEELWWLLLRIQRETS